MNPSTLGEWSKVAVLGRKGSKVAGIRAEVLEESYERSEGFKVAAQCAVCVVPRQRAARLGQSVRHTRFHNVPRSPRRSAQALTSAASSQTRRPRRGASMTSALARCHSRLPATRRAAFSSCLVWFWRYH